MSAVFDPFAVPDNRRHLRHAFYLRHPELDERSEADLELDEAAYVARSPRPEVARAQLGRPGYADGWPPPRSTRDPGGSLPDAVRDFLDGRATLDDLREALDREGKGEP